MSKGLKFAFVVIGVIIAASALLMMGIAIGRTYTAWNAFSPWTMMTTSAGPGYAAGIMAPTYGPEGDYEPYEMMGAYGPMGGLMGPVFNDSPSASVEPLTIDEAAAAVEAFAERVGDEALRVGDVMIFDNHAYAQIIEEETGLGAMEVLVDPVTLNVYPEMGPNMMWNLKYGGIGMMGGFGGPMHYGYTSVPGSAPDLPESANDMPVSGEEAIELAQDYLDTYLPGTQADEHADPFYGYYTIHIMRDGETIGMLSVNAFTGRVFLHNWHGAFVEMS